MRAVALIAAACFALALPSAAAAKCAPLSEPEARAVSDVVFEGVVGQRVGELSTEKVTEGKPPETVGTIREFGFRVARYLEGNGEDGVVVRRSLVPDSFPRTNPQPGEAWIVYGRRVPGAFIFSECVPYSRALGGAEAARVHTLVAARAAESDDGGDEDDGGSSLPVIVIFTIGVGIAGLIAFRIARR